MGLFRGLDCKQMPKADGLGGERQEREGKEHELQMQTHNDLRRNWEVPCD